jgi:methylated-DNA-[protein]-cysteine S-methyltransferase
MNEIDPAVAMHQHTNRAPRMRNASLPPSTPRLVDKSLSHSRRQPAHQIDAPDVKTTARSVPVDIVAAAEQPGADACDICCDAMPAHVLGDLTPPENAWLVTHTDCCDHCASVLHRYEKVDAMLDRLHDVLDPLPAPPPFIIPKATKAPAPTTSTRSRVSARAARRTAHFGTMDSPVGPLRVAVSDIGVAEISYTASESEDEFRKRVLARGFDLVPADASAGDIAPVTQQLTEYFGGQRKRFDLPIDFGGLTPFTRSVLDATAGVPFGELKTYGDIAAQIGSPGASRAVGNALGRNPIPVIVPCHRIVMSDLSIGGYTGGIAIKERLLSIEGVRPRDLGLT